MDTLVCLEGGGEFYNNLLVMGKIIENYEIQLNRVNEENKQMKERYEK